MTILGKLYNLDTADDEIQFPTDNLDIENTQKA